MARKPSNQLQVIEKVPNATCTYRSDLSKFVVTGGKRKFQLGEGSTVHQAWKDALNAINNPSKFVPPPPVTIGDADTRKTLPQLKGEWDKHRRMLNRTFVHKRTGDHYMLIGIAFDEHTNATLAVYCVCSTPWLKFVRGMEEFVDKFDELGELK